MLCYHFSKPGDENANHCQEVARPEKGKGFCHKKMSTGSGLSTYPDCAFSLSLAVLLTR